MKTKRFFSIYGRTLWLVAALTLGILVPQASVLSPVVPASIMLMLFCAFLGVPISLRSFKPYMFVLLGANVAIAFLGYLVLLPLDRTLALVAFMTGITPSATASPVITGFLGGRVDRTAAAMLLTNVCIALLLPEVMPLVTGRDVSFSAWDVLKSVVVMVFIPFTASRLAGLLPQRQFDALTRIKPYSFPLWLASLVIITAKASHFIRGEASVSFHTLLPIILTSLVICVVNFAAGRLIGGKKNGREASQALGQKNTTLPLWLSLAFMGPVVAMGPAFYILFHNLWNSIQLSLVNRVGRKPLPRRT